LSPWQFAFLNRSKKVAQHLKENPSHSISFDKSLEILHRCNNSHKAKVWEEYNIFKHFEKFGSDRMLNKKEEFSNKITFQLFNRLENNFTDKADNNGTDMNGTLARVNRNNAGGQ
jgi:hypothetical protein